MYTGKILFLLILAIKFNVSQHHTVTASFTVLPWPHEDITASSKQAYQWSCQN